MSDGVLFLGRQPIVDKDSHLVCFKSVNSFKLQA